ncbi:tryptophan 2,3-dioxygenase [Irpex rosettiformis]|uniref:Tryptophan 2,3-dioxygenase n=1 Tax=Irpex rosettiformis TaxID=378272 RepID=A0ACB8U9K0_9APHY|nr:tryptophan 2,3-dioxygenase [Irpex rosettiformis]
MSHLPPDHFLSLPRPEAVMGPPPGTVDTTTLAAHDFDVDNRTGFMPPQPPLTRLPESWSPWEEVLDDAVASNLQLGDKLDLSDADRSRSAEWRARVRALPILPTHELKKSEILLRRSHHVLSWIMHFYTRTLPPSSPDIRIPPPITLPLLQVSEYLQLPPVLTYSDDVLYNWELKMPQGPLSPAPELDNLKCLTLFTGTRDEEEFYLSSARIELRGVEALSIMRATMDETFVGDDIAIRRITAYLHSLSSVIGELTKLLLAVREGCDPQVFYNEIRPWFRGADSDVDAGKKWIFEGLELDPTLTYPAELSGPSAGQSSLIHALDVFLGVDKYSHAPHVTGVQPTAGTPGTSSSASPTSTSAPDSKPSVSFLTRMQSYMPRHHRNFLRHLSANPRPLREFVETSANESLTEAYNAAVTSLKKFRDAHVRIVAIYIVGPSRRNQRPMADLKGTGGTNSIRFVKSVRDQTAGAVLDSAH